MVYLKLSARIARKLRDLRKSLGKTQREFADDLGVRQTQISRFELGEVFHKQTIVTPTAISKIATKSGILDDAELASIQRRLQEIAELSAAVKKAVQDLEADQLGAYHDSD